MPQILVMAKPELDGLKAAIPRQYSIIALLQANF